MMRKLALSVLAMAAVPVSLVATSGSAHAGSIEAATPTNVHFESDRQVFYPTVRDGYLDGVGFSTYADPIPTQWESGWDYAEQEWTITILNSSGNLVASHSETMRGGDSGWYVGGNWSWDGRNRAGNSVSAGSFTAKVEFYNKEVGVSDQYYESIDLTAKHGYVVARHAKTRLGNDPSSTSRTRFCHANRYAYNRTLDLDCWGDTNRDYAIARYGFGIPSNSRNITWSVAGTRGCCTGQVIKTASRPTSSSYRVVVKVTNMAEYEIRKATINYTTTVLR